VTPLRSPPTPAPPSPWPRTTTSNVEVTVRTATVRRICVANDTNVRRGWTETADTKSRAGRRAIGLPGQIVSLLRKHQEIQNGERETAGQLWQEGGWVFATPTGEPLNPRTDYTGWKRLLKAAGIRVGRLHDARHTAATVLLILGVAERAVMGIMGWSNTAMATTARPAGLYGSPEPSGTEGGYDGRWPTVRH
jgi:integrase